ncbi:1,4-alpha-glucan branching protein GlgB [Paraneptunicella aestuarii]|uniref:1,4-alpha-glucan branching protein GlgB n=1 Tax=Paraneptunicella aestuarii TaxID=2831148 RepID=UPI001E4DA896|nr:1,4-alpha-glucan branching protein GlgB [Paraneptunicella aestuarii]UAA40427.1 1,4-alpha-glucan branching protein GlgB [Paraneptunicella aestuarii]
MQIEQQLQQARCPFPFEFLGLHKTEEGFILRAWLPHAESVSATNLETGADLGELQKQGELDLFVAELSDCQEHFLYSFQVTTANGVHEVIDPYQFEAQAYHAVHYVDHHPENVYNQLGAQLIELHVGLKDGVKGTRFAVFAPNASAVSVIGDFNWWNGACHPMQKTDMGYWVLFVPGVNAGVQYKYQIKDKHGHQLPHKADPVGFYSHQYPSLASEVFDQNGYQWQDQAWMERESPNLYSSAMSIYEVHLGSWRRHINEDGTSRSLTYRELAEQLIPYVKDMGFTHIEMLPVSEHPFDGSWGYQPVGLFSPTSRFGTPDDFKYFVDQCHQNGIGVIMDWVPAHFPEDGHGLARFDGTHLYEYEDPRKGWHPDWNSCIYDYGKDTVRQFLVANALFWVDKFHIDGLRVDAVASMLYLDYSRKEGEWIPNIDGGNKNYEAISLLQWMNKEVYDKFPKSFTVAEESTAFPKVSRPVYEGGLGFGFKWNMGWMHDSLHFISKDPAYRSHHHNEITFSLVYAFDENFVLPISHDEVVHGKGSLLRKMPGDEWQQAANLRCYTAFMYGHPGKKLNFMGNEIGQPEEWNHSSSLSWHLLDYDKHRGAHALFRSVNHLYATLPALHDMDGESDGFEWIDHHNHEQSILAFVRKSRDGKQKVYVISNFTPVPRENMRFGVLDDGEYQQVLNTDEGQYWGSDYTVNHHLHSEHEPCHGRPRSIRLTLPPLATLYIVYNEV